MQTILSRLAVAALALSLACTPAKPDPSGGTPSTGGARPPGSGGGPPSAGTGGSPNAGTGGASIGTGGALAGTGGGPAGTGGTPSGTGGAPAPDASTETTPPADAASGVALAGRLHRYLRSLKCVRGNPDDTRRSCYADEKEALDKHDVLPFAGDPNVVYDVVVRIRGIIEPRVYSNGTPGTDSQWWYVGGSPGGPGDNRFYNVYKLVVSEPQQTYYLNNDYMKILGTMRSRDHDLHNVNYTGTIKVKGGATVDVVNQDMPSGMNRNFMMHKVAGVPTELINQEPNGFDGQFFYIEVESVTPAK